MHFAHPSPVGVLVQLLLVSRVKRQGVRELEKLRIVLCTKPGECGSLVAAQRAKFSGSFPRDDFVLGNDDVVVTLEKIQQLVVLNGMGAYRVLLAVHVVMKAATVALFVQFKELA